MGNDIFPSLPGMKWSKKKTPVFKTTIQRGLSGRELRLSQMIYPLWQYELSYELLRADAAKLELQKLLGFYLKQNGALSSFLYEDGPDDKNVANQSIAVGNGQNNYQLVRTYGANTFTFVEPCLDIQANSSNTPLNIYVAGNKLSANQYSVNLGTGVVTMGSTPANNAAITADFWYYKRCRFIEYGEGDEAFSEFMNQLFEAQKVSFITCR